MPEQDARIRQPRQSCGIDEFALAQRQDLGAHKPLEGRELFNVELANALTFKANFTEDEWRAFGITDLRVDDFIKSEKKWFRPDGRNKQARARPECNKPKPPPPPPPADPASGLHWRTVAEQPVGGHELTNERLAKALDHKAKTEHKLGEHGEHKVDFTKREWERFGVKDLLCDFWIKGGDTYFQPVPEPHKHHDHGHHDHGHHDQHGHHDHHHAAPAALDAAHTAATPPLHGAHAAPSADSSAAHAAPPPAAGLGHPAAAAEPGGQAAAAAPPPPPPPSRPTVRFQDV